MQLEVLKAGRDVTTGKVKAEEKVDAGVLQVDVDPQVASLPRQDGLDSYNRPFLRHSSSLVAKPPTKAEVTYLRSHHVNLEDHFQDKDHQNIREI